MAQQLPVASPVTAALAALLVRLAAFECAGKAARNSSMQLIEKRVWCSFYASAGPVTLIQALSLSREDMALFACSEGES